MNQCLKSVLFAITFIFGCLCENFNGDVTYYTSWKGNFGSCGLERSKTDPFYVSALSPYFMHTSPDDPNPNHDPLCGPEYCVQIFGQRGSVVLKISDTCPPCNDFDVDVADEVYGRLDDPSKGRVKMSWQFVNCNQNPPGFKNYQNIYDSFDFFFKYSSKTIYNTK